MAFPSREGLNERPSFSSRCQKRSPKKRLLKGFDALEREGKKVSDFCSIFGGGKFYGSKERMLVFRYACVKLEINIFPIRVRYFLEAKTRVTVFVDD